MAQLFPYLLVLACPISMGVMMWMMMRGGHSQGDHSRMGMQSQTGPAPTTSDQRIAELEGQVAELRDAAARREREAAEEQPSRRAR